MSQPWDLPEREATPEKVVLSRRRWLKRIGLGTLALGAAGGAIWYHWFRPGTDDEVLRSNPFKAPGTDLYPAERNKHFAEVGGALTEEAECARWTNFYEFSYFKDTWRNVRDFQPVPWTVEVPGPLK
jgi:hypothetical protein